MSSKSSRLSALGLLLVVGGCEIEKIAIPPTQAFVALHGVLSATAASQVVVLERTRNGSIEITVPADNPDPVVTDEGIAVSGAFAQLISPSGDTLIGRDTQVKDVVGDGPGIYRFPLAGAALERGGKYRLLVVTAEGEVLTAATSVPAGVAATVVEQVVFDRRRDSLIVEWPAAPGARTYFVRIETPFGPRSFFTDSTRIWLTGDLRNVDVTSLPRVFMPGFPQTVTVSAVDSNYYDWYRTHNERLSGTGLVNRVRGGIGVFGSLVRLRFVDLRVVAPQPEPAEGMFRFVGTNFERSVTPFLSLELYIESRTARADQADAISGRYEQRPVLGDNDPFGGVLGTVRNGRVQLVFLRSWSARDTMEVFTGEIRGDTIVGDYRGLGGSARFVKQP